MGTFWRMTINMRSFEELKLRTYKQIFEICFSSFTSYLPIIFLSCKALKTLCKSWLLREKTECWTCICAFKTLKLVTEQTNFNKSSNLFRVESNLVEQRIFVLFKLGDKLSCKSQK